MAEHSIGKMIAALRKTKGWTQVELAEKLNISDKAVSKWESEAGYPEITMFPRLADLFGVSIDYLMTGKEENEKEPQLKPKDQKDIKEILANTEQLLKQDGLMFDGDPASPEAIDSILSAMQVGMEMAKKKNKEKYTPKKYKKD